MADTTFTGGYGESRQGKNPLVLVFLMAAILLGIVVMIQANRHALARHGEDAILAQNCYNNNGAWKVYREGNTTFHMLCLDEGNIVRDVILERESSTSNNFRVKSMFTPKDGNWTLVERWLMNKNAMQVQAPNPINILP